MSQDKKKYIRPSPLEGHSEILAAINKDRRKQEFPDELRPFIYKFVSSEFLKMAVKTAKETTYDRRKLETIANPDLSMHTFTSQPTLEKEQIKREFRGKITMPLILFSRKHNERWILTDKPSLVYNFRILNKEQMNVLEIPC